MTTNLSNLGLRPALLRQLDFEGYETVEDMLLLTDQQAVARHAVLVGR